MKSETFDVITVFFAELLGTAFLVFLGCTGCVANSTFANSHLQACFNFGLVVLLIVQMFGCVSGSHLNPTVTLAAWIYGLVTAKLAIVYFCAQMLGGYLGYGLMKVLLPASAFKDYAYGLCVTMPHKDMTGFQAAGLEFVITSCLILVCCAVWDPRNISYVDSVSVRFGFVIACLAITGGQFTGASMNPARSFAPAIWNNEFESHWVYWVGPMLGSLCSAYLYRTIFRRELQTDIKQITREEVPLN